MKQSTRKIAERFIRDQIAIMRKHGHAPKASKKRIKAAIQGAEKSIVAMGAWPDKLDLR